MLNCKQYIAITIFAIVFGIGSFVFLHNISWIDFMVGSFFGGVIAGLRNA